MLEAAVNGQAEALITHNVGDFHAATERFGIRTPTPGTFLKELTT
jgi:predicted nucleic acid-binding protein